MDHGVTAASYATGEQIESSERSSRNERILEFYEEAGLDFAHWSRDLNMHLGFYRLGMNPFDRESMVQRLNAEVAERLKPESANAILIDLGCGFGGVARAVARRFPHSFVMGVTLSPLQAAKATQINVDCGLDRRIEILRHDFTSLPLPDASADGAWAVESACYARGADKEDLIREAARVLKSGGRFVVVDCFVKRPEREFGPVIGRCYSKACRSWAVEEMPTLECFVNTLRRHGFGEITIEDVSWNAAPSVAHAPFSVAGFLFRKLLSRSRINRCSLDNLVASLLTLPIGLSRSNFSYCIIAGRRG